MKKLVGLVTLMTLSCSTYSRKQCLSFDWQNKGFESAMNGQLKRDSYLYYQEKCGKEHGIAPEETSFDLGYQKGIDQLCTVEGGRRLGQKGFSYQHLCPAEKEEVFIKSFRSGRLEFLESQVEKLQEKIKALEYDNSRQASEISSLQSKLMSCR